MRLISRVKALAGALLLAGCLTQQAAAASFVGNRDDFRDETIYFVMTTRFYDGDKSNNVQCWDGHTTTATPLGAATSRALLRSLTTSRLSASPPSGLPL